MENMLILQDILQKYISEQPNMDQNILNMFIQNNTSEYDIARITGYSRSRINRTIRKLRVYLRKLNYNT